MTNPSTAAPSRQSTPLSISGSIDGDSDPPVKNPRPRKPTKKPVPHSSTLRGLWGIAKPTDEQSEALIDQPNGGEDNGVPVVKPGEPIVLKINPGRLAAVVAALEGQQRMITPPRSLPDVVPQTPVQASAEDPKTPKSSSGRKRSLPQSPSEVVRRSPRNRVQEPTPTPTAQAPVKEKKKPHPFFLGKEARQALQATAQPTPPITTTLTDDGEPLRKRQMSSSSDPQPPTSDTNSLLPSKPIHAQVAKSLHPFFMSRTASMESAVSTTSVPLLPLPQGKTVYLGNATPASFPKNRTSHIYDPSPLPPLRHKHNIPPRRIKGKSRFYDHQRDISTYTRLTNKPTFPDFLPPTKLIIPQSQIISQAQSLLPSDPHHALLRANQILTTETRTQGEPPTSDPWTHKFRPHTADEVLSLPAAQQLRSWIRGSRKHVSLPSEWDEMDDFIVDETKSEPDSPEKGGRRKKKEKFVAYSNVVILTGVHGTGKSAAVEAVAEECGYQVFEISPGSRRGAKELMEAVGEVGQSELVTKHRAVETAPRLLRTAEQEEEEERKKGRKAMVCLDEVDVLYEEDRGFWGCVTGLVERSRRPLVMTCNDASTIPENFANCMRIEFLPPESSLVRDYLQLITLSQGHIIDPPVLEKLYLDNKLDFRKTLTELQFWCQFSVGDRRGGAEWINWGGIPSDWVMSRNTLVDGITWRQEISLGPDTVLQTLEEQVPELDLEDMIFPHEFHDKLTNSPISIFKRQKCVFVALKGISEFLDTMSFLDSTVDRQFTAYEITPFVEPLADDVVSEPVLREHPGRRFEEPQGGEVRWSPGIRNLAREVLDMSLKDGGYQVEPFSSENMIRQPLQQHLHPRLCHTREEICESLDGILYTAASEDRFQATLGTLHSPATIIVDVAPQIRHILRVEHERRKFKPQQLSLENLWTNKRTTRRKLKEEKEGRKRYFENRLESESVLKTWLEVTCSKEEDEMKQVHEEA